MKYRQLPNSIYRPNYEGTPLRHAFAIDVSPKTINDVQHTMAETIAWIAINISEYDYRRWQVRIDSDVTKNGDLYYTDFAVFFRDGEDAMAFKLRWIEENE